MCVVREVKWLSIINTDYQMNFHEQQRVRGVIQAYHKL